MMKTTTRFVTVTALVTEPPQDSRAHITAVEYDGYSGETTLHFIRGAGEAPRLGARLKITIEEVER